MALQSASLWVKTGDTSRRPDAPLNLALSTLLSPNPGSTSFRIKYDAAAVPTGGTAVTSYQVYLNGTLAKTVTGREPTIDAIGTTALTPATAYAVTVTASNADGEGPPSATLPVTTAAAGTAPGVPANPRYTARTDTTVTLAWDAVTATPTPEYRIYDGTETTPRKVIAAGGGTTGVVTDLLAVSDHSFTITAANSGGESARSAAVPVTTTGTVTLEVMRADDVLNYHGINAKVTYGSGTYDYGTAANKQAVIDHSKAMGFRVYRQMFASSGATQTAQMDYMKAVYANQGCRFHCTLTTLANAGGNDVPNMTDAQVRVYAATEVRACLDSMVADYKPDVDLCNGGDLSTVFHSIGGPNEVENTNNNGANWASHARIVQEQIWRGMREGKFWDATAGTSGAFVATRVGAGTGAAAKDFRTLFANVPVAGPSTRTDLTITTARTLAGGFISGTSGDRIITQWVEMGNPHLYQAGASPSRGIDTSITAYSPIVPSPGYPTVHHLFSETGYNHDGWDVDGTDLTTTTLSGNVKVPPWVHSTYSVRAIADYAKKKVEYVRHELLDDVSATFGIQAFFGVVATPSTNPTTWTPLGDYYAVRRLYNLLRDRSNVKVPASHSTTAPPFSITARGATGTNLLDLVTQKSDGSFWLLLWRDVDVWSTTNTGNTGQAVNVADVNITLTFTHTTGTKTIDMWTPNKANWDGVAGSTKSTGHGTSTTWSTIPAGETSWSVASTANPKTITVPVGGNLRVLRIV